MTRHTAAYRKWWPSIKTGYITIYSVYTVYNSNTTAAAGHTVGVGLGVGGRQHHHTAACRGAGYCDNIIESVSMCLLWNHLECPPLPFPPPCFFQLQQGLRGGAQQVSPAAQSLESLLTVDCAELVFVARRETTPPPRLPRGAPPPQPST